jgi:tRNA nucleotidyltransferase (CCA-adding enzyme)
MKDVKLYLVGGCVRDMILNRPNKDKDYIAITKLSFDELCFEIQKEGGKIFVSKPEFLTIRCLINNEVIDIAFPRKEERYDDNRHPSKVERVNTLKADAGRRDFTMNSIYWNEKEGFIDYYNGITDIKNKIIKTTGSPEVRFKEDYLRILRAIRFSCQLNFEIDDNTYFYMIQLAKHIAEVEPNRVREEINKALISNPQKLFRHLNILELCPIIQNMGLGFECTSKSKCLNSSYTF